jgi:hypothetical protein
MAAELDPESAPPGLLHGCLLFAPVPHMGTFDSAT